MRRSEAQREASKRAWTILRLKGAVKFVRELGLAYLADELEVKGELAIKSKYASS